MRRWLVVVLLVAGCADDGGSPPATSAQGCREARDGRVTVVARDLAWDTDCVTAPAGAPLVIVVDNRDDAVNHNLRLTKDLATVLDEGPVVQELAVTLPEGTYEYVCDLHPTMVGELVLGGQVTPPG